MPDDPQAEIAFWQGIEECADYLARRLTEPEARGFLHSIKAASQEPCDGAIASLRRRCAHTALSVLVSIIRTNVLPVLRPMDRHRVKRKVVIASEGEMGNH